MHKLATATPIRCRCGRLQGQLAQGASVARVACYCIDCQSYAHALGKPELVLDELGGTDVITSLQQHLSFSGDTSTLACLSLSEPWHPALVRRLLFHTGGQHRAQPQGVVCGDRAHLRRIVAHRTRAGVRPARHGGEYAACQGAGAHGRAAHRDDRRRGHRARGRGPARRLLAQDPVLRWRRASAESSSAPC